MPKCTSQATISRFSAWPSATCSCATISLRGVARHPHVKRANSGCANLCAKGSPVPYRTLIRWADPVYQLQIVRTFKPTYRRTDGRMRRAHAFRNGASSGVPSGGTTTPHRLRTPHCRRPFLGQTVERRHHVAQKCLDKPRLGRHPSH